MAEYEFYVLLWLFKLNRISTLYFTVIHTCPREILSERCTCTVSYANYSLGGP